MNARLQSGQRLQSVPTGARVTIERFLGGGTQGDVYGARRNERLVAVKWFRPEYVARDSHLVQRLNRLIAWGTPAQSFVWPESLVVDRQQGVGYVMPLVDGGCIPLAAVASRSYPVSFPQLVTIAYEVINAFWRLHSRGWCHRDISGANVLVNPQTGQVRIIDNDCVTVEGDAHHPIDGTPGFMAPEIVSGQTKPNIDSDCFAATVLLFQLLYAGHPLHGRREQAIRLQTPSAMRRLYGKNAVFLFDPQDDSNRPVPGVHDNPLLFWRIYPASLNNLFTKTFTAGLRDPRSGRVAETTWRGQLAALRDAMFTCKACHATNFYDPPPPGVHQGYQGVCWNCGQALRIPPRLALPATQQVVVLTPGRTLTAHHLDARRPHDFGRALARVSEDGALENLSLEAWTLEVGRDALLVRPGRRVRLTQTMTLVFATARGTVHV